ncbi:MAG: hypothetical protein KJ626_05305, partial [Verrucomicrobia bacterium]|nr:hypothetical protein [Verrucomicrobiota bacterium]
PEDAVAIVSRQVTVTAVDGKRVAVRGATGDLGVIVPPGPHVLTAEYTDGYRRSEPMQLKLQARPGGRYLISAWEARTNLFQMSSSDRIHMLLTDVTGKRLHDWSGLTGKSWEIGRVEITRDISPTGKTESLNIQEFYWSPTRDISILVYPRSTPRATVGVIMYGLLNMGVGTSIGMRINDKFGEPKTISYPPGYADVARWLRQGFLKDMQLKEVPGIDTIHIDLFDAQ